MNEAVEDQNLGDLICGSEYDEVKMKLDELDQGPKLAAMLWLESNNWFIFEKEEWALFATGSPITSNTLAQNRWNS